MYVTEHHSLEELEELIQKTPHATLRDRLRIVYLARQQHTGGKIAELLQTSPASVTRWVSRYNKSGLKGLQTRPGQGRKRKPKSNSTQESPH